jgi:glyoxylase-like metal-dependent hydrolase (beta-lactamase superfamily II)
VKRVCFGLDRRLVASGFLLCGDLLSNTDHPALSAIMDDLAAGASLKVLNRLSLQIVYPGHGDPLCMEHISRRNAIPFSEQLI